MHLSCLVVSHDPDVHKTVAEVFAGIDLLFRKDSSGASQAISQNHFDAFFIDCDGMTGSPDVISAIRGSHPVLSLFANYRREQLINNSDLAAR